MEEKEVAKFRKYNMKLYPIFRMFSLDIIFFYTIKVLFLTQINGIELSSILLATACFSLVKTILQIPITIIIDKLGPKYGAMLGSIFNVFYLVLMLMSTNLPMLIIAEVLSSIGFAFKNVSDPMLLDAAIPKTENHGHIYSKIEGKGRARYYYIDAAASVLAGFLYAVNPYIPVILGIIFLLVATSLAYKFKDIPAERETIKKVSIQEETKNYMVNLKRAFSFIIKSKRLKSLLLYSGLMWGVVCLVGTYQTNLLIDLQIPAQFIGIISATMKIVAGLSANYQNKFHNKHHNKSLGMLAIRFSIATIVAGICTMVKLPYIVIIAIVIGCYGMMKISQAMYGVLVYRYYNNFSNQELQSKIYTADELFTCLVRAVIEWGGSILIAITTTANSMMIVGGIALVLFIVLLGYMQTRVGLKVQEYKKEEIEYNPVH